MALKQVKYIQIDDEKGILYSAGKQSLLIPTDFIQNIDFIFSQLVGKEGKEILMYKLGEGLGKGYVQSLESILKKEKISVGLEARVSMSCNAMCMEAGWGRIKILKIDLDKTILEVEFTHSPSIELLKETDYSLERGVLAGLYKQIVKEEVWCKLVKEDKKSGSIILKIIKEIPQEIREKENIVLLTRQKLEEEIKKSKEQLQERVGQLERFHRLAVGRELKMIELKKEIEKLKKELEKYRGREE